jgi:hypothetical protein
MDELVSGDELHGRRPARLDGMGAAVQGGDVPAVDEHREREDGSPPSGSSPVYVTRPVPPKSPRPSSLTRIESTRQSPSKIGSSAVGPPLGRLLSLAASDRRSHPESR